MSGPRKTPLSFGREYQTRATIWCALNLLFEPRRCTEFIVEPPSQEDIAKRGGVWFEGGTLRLHLSIETEFRAAMKAHPAFLFSTSKRWFGISSARVSAW